MRELTTLFLCFLVGILNAQVRISGNVYDEDNTPLMEASVYINNTSIGTTTDEDGFFSLQLKEGTYELIISYVGYETLKKGINTATYKSPTNYKLKSIYDELDEVVIKKKKKKRKRSARRNAYIRKFKKQFLGESKFASNCEIMNEEVLDPEFDPYENVLDVYASEPLKIMNNDLGYMITYDLVHFTLTPKDVNYLGNTKYEKLSGTEKQQRKWIANREKAYRGSKMHFLRSMMKDQVTDQGFIVDKIERAPHPDRPSYKEIIEAEKKLKKTSGLQRDPFGRQDLPEVAKARKVLQKAQSLPEFRDKVVKRNITEQEYGLVYEGEHNLRFSDYIRVTYTKEKPDKKHKNETKSKYQVSMLLLYNKVAEIRKAGVLKKPLEVFLQGYWAFEKVGDALPLDYEPGQ